MTQQEFESYLALMSRLLKLSNRQREAISGELDDHLQRRLEDLQNEGVPREEAVRLALEEFGDAAALARDFQEVSQSRKKRWIMRMTVGSLSAALAGLLIVSLYWPAGKNPVAPQEVVAQQGEEAATSGDTAGQKTKTVSTLDRLSFRTMRALKTMTDLNALGEPLTDVMAGLGEQHAINVYIDERAIEESDGSSASDITIETQFSDVPLATVLDLILSQHGLTYSTRSGILIITTQEAAEANPVVRIYNVHSLLATRGQQRKLEHLTVEIDSAARQLRKLKTDIVQDGFQNGRLLSRFDSLQEPLEILKNELQNYSSEQLPSYAYRTEALVKLIYKTVDSRSWEDNGGAPGSNIVPFKGSLIVTTTERTHRKVEKMLQDLETIAKQNTDAPFLPQKKVSPTNSNRGGRGR